MALFSAWVRLLLLATVRKVRGSKSISVALLLNVKAAHARGFGAVRAVALCSGHELAVVAGLTSTHCDSQPARMALVLRWPRQLAVGAVCHPSSIVQQVGWLVIFHIKLRLVVPV